MADIAEVTMVGPTTILVTAKKPGNTQVIVWNEKDQSQAIDVSVKEEQRLKLFGELARS